MEAIASSLNSHPSFRSRILVPSPVSHLCTRYPPLPNAAPKTVLKCPEMYRYMPKCVLSRVRGAQKCARDGLCTGAAAYYHAQGRLPYLPTRYYKVSGIAGRSRDLPPHLDCCPRSRRARPHRKVRADLIRSYPVAKSVPNAKHAFIIWGGAAEPGGDQVQDQVPERADPYCGRGTKLCTVSVQLLGWVAGTIEA
eukprot:2050982-Rhodomonas_salina.2